MLDRLYAVKGPPGKFRSGTVRFRFASSASSVAERRNSCSARAINSSGVWGMRAMF